MVKVSQLVIVKCMKLKLVNTDQLNNNECEGCNTVIKINKFIVSLGNNMHVGQQMLTDKETPCFVIVQDNWCSICTYWQCN